MPASPARSAAFDILFRVERESSYAPELLHSAAYKNLSTSDHALTTELVMGVLRWRSALDHKISRASSQPLKKLDLEIRIALRIALYQFLYLDRIPHRAALHESVELVKRARKRSAAPFVNAVLRKLASTSSYAPVIANQGAPLKPDFGLSGDFASSSQDLAEAFAHPEWLVERWTNQYGPQATHQICRYNQSIPEVSLRLRTPQAESKLNSEGIALAPGNLLAQARRVLAGDVTKSRVFQRGKVVIQDETSQLIAALVGTGHTRILDCCAAPGGKTLAIADQNPNTEITAVEIHPHRARLMRTRFPQDTRIDTVVADATNLQPTDPYDRILVDVPCSGTGTLARNPEIKWRLKPQDIVELQARQLAILRSALKHLKPGGQLIYSTCSLEKEENEDVINQVLLENPTLQLRNCRAELERLKTMGVLTWPDPLSLTRGPYLRTIPGIHPCDGFFSAILERLA